MKSIDITNISTHNLKHINVSIPHGKITVVTGLSGSGKSSLAIDTLYAEGQRRYIESLSPYTRQFLERMEKPKIDSISGLLPALCIEAKNVITNARSTVGTHTEVNDFLRILFSRVGKRYFKGKLIKVDYVDTVVEELLQNRRGSVVGIVFSISLGKKSKQYLSDNLDEIKRLGFERVLVKDSVASIDGREYLMKALKGCSEIDVVLDRQKIEPRYANRLKESLQKAYQFGKGYADVAFFKDSTMKQLMERRLYSSRYACAELKKEFAKPEPNLFSFNNPVGACGECEGFGRVIVRDTDLIVPNKKLTLLENAISPWGKPSAEWEKKQMLEFAQRHNIPTDIPFKQLKARDIDKLFNGVKGDDYQSVHGFFDYLEKKTYKMHVRIFLSRYRNYVECPSCGGARLKSEALEIKIGEKSIYELQQLTVKDLRLFIQETSFTQMERQLIGPALEELNNRLRYLDEVGLGYLTLARHSRTLSGGEMQRINLASALGTQLVETLYVLDEPSIGLHDRDNERLIRILDELKQLGNTVVVIEHDERIMQAADHIIDMGPGAGSGGGEIIAEGTLKQISKNKVSKTARYLRGEEVIHLEPDGRKPTKKRIGIRGACEHNLKNVSVDIPLNQFVVVTGVSGSGKSTLIRDCLYKNYQREMGQAVSDVGSVKSLTGLQHIDAITYIDQAPLGRSSRSCPITYSGAYSDLRKLFASTREAKVRGFSAGDFSFNTKGGRCEKCEGLGQVKEEMHFLADVYLKCESCKGLRFKDDIFKVKYNGKSIADVFEMTVNDAIEFFHLHAPILRRLSVLRDVGLGYLTLAQPTVTLSAGEAQRMKLASEMLENKRTHQLYIFDEPTVGLHYHDIQFLMQAFSNLLTRGHSLILIEHNLEVIRNAEHILDMGPEGGLFGGELIHAGSVEELLKNKLSLTAQSLREHMRVRNLSAS